MNVPKAAPGEGPKKERDHFPHWSIGGGERHFAYIAGATAWVIAHPSDKGTKPCLCWMTDNALPCRLCAMGKCPARVGYVPVYRAIDWKPLLVIVYDEEQEWIDKCDTHDRVQIGREREKGARLWVRKCADQEPKYATTVARRQHAQDVDESMLTLWKMPELIAWLQCRRVSDNAVTLAPREASKPPASAPAGVKPYVPPDDGAADQRLVDYPALAKRIARGEPVKPSGNGRHDK